MPSNSPIDAYLRKVPVSQRKALQALRETIRSIVPDAEECISYRLPAFRVNGKVVAGFYAFEKWCSYFPFSGKTFKTLAADIEKYDRTKSALHFDPERGLPKTLVRKLVKTRLAEIA